MVYSSTGCQQRKEVIVWAVSSKSAARRFHDTSIARCVARCASNGASRKRATARHMPQLAHAFGRFRGNSDFAVASARVAVIALSVALTSPSGSQAPSPECCTAQNTNPPLPITRYCSHAGESRWRPKGQHMLGVHARAPEHQPVTPVVERPRSMPAADICTDSRYLRLPPPCHHRAPPSIRSCDRRFSRAYGRAPSRLLRDGKV